MLAQAREEEETVAIFLRNISVHVFITAVPITSTLQSYSRRGGG